MRTGGALAWLIYSTHQIIADKIVPERSNIYVAKCSIQFGKKPACPSPPTRPNSTFPAHHRRILRNLPYRAAAPCPNASQRISMTSINI